MPAAAQSILDGRYRDRVVKIKGTSSYTTGGYDLPAFMTTAVPNNSYAPIALNDGSAVIGLVASGKVKFITAATGAEVANATDMSAVTVSVLVP
jgi:hypothetical protein